MSQSLDRDTIVAIATAPGRGGVGVVRLSGPQAIKIAQSLSGRVEPLEPRVATFTSFKNSRGEIVDRGLCLAFPGPASFTGEDVAEIQGHGSPVVLDAIVQSAIAVGARMARPGEFSERAYLNGKMDLAQAEAVADLINAESLASARAAMRSLQGEFSHLLNALSADLVALRVQVEAAIDFPEEDIELLAEPAIGEALENLLQSVRAVVHRTLTGVRLTEGARLVLIGAPNVGKSSVLNRLCGEDRAIVTPVAGTTRDLLREQLLLGGMPVELVDTAGMRQTSDPVEAEGVRRAQKAARDADVVLAIYDQSDSSTIEFLLDWIPNERSVSDKSLPPLLIVGNKQDLGFSSKTSEPDEVMDGMLGRLGELALTYRCSHLGVSALTGDGIDELNEHLVGVLTGSGHEDSAAPIPTDTFSARSRHLIALQESLSALMAAQEGIRSEIGAELVAEYLRHAQADLGSVCGEISTDELLGQIFSSFCIGK